MWHHPQQLKKYLKPSKVGVEYGPHTSIWTKSKAQLLILLWKEKVNLLSFAIGQIWQSLLHEGCKEGITWHKVLSLTSEGWLNLACQMEEDGEGTRVEVAAVKWLKTSLMSATEKATREELDECWRLSDCNRYNPSSALLTPIVF